MRAVAAHFGWELRKIFRSRPAWLGIVGTVLFEAVLFILLKFPSVRPAANKFLERFGYSFADNFTALTLAQNILGQSVLLGVVFVALVAGESISREVESGTLRLVLCRPVSRGRVWLVKLLACAAYTLVLTTVAAFAALGLGVVLEGWGPMLIHISATGARVAYAPFDGLRLYVMAIPFLSLSIFTAAALAFALSSCGVRGSAATVAAIGYLLGEELLRQMPFLASVRHWFLMSHVTAWNRAFEARADWGWAGEVYGPLLLFDAFALAAGFWIFQRRDFKP